MSLLQTASRTRLLPAPGTDAYRDWRRDASAATAAQAAADERAAEQARADASREANARALAEAAAAALAEREREHAVILKRVAKKALARHPATVILREVAATHGVTVKDICGGSRKAKMVRARQEAMWRMRTEASMAFPEIGRRIGGKDHTTALHGFNAHAARIATPASRVRDGEG